MMIYFVLISNSLKSFDSSGYPINRQSMLCGWKALLLSSEIQAHVVDPNTLRFDTSGLCPNYDTKVVFHFTNECGTLIWIYTAACMASAHKFAASFFDSNIQVVIPWEIDSSFPLLRSAGECRELNAGPEYHFGRICIENRYWHTPLHYHISRYWS